MKKIVVLLCLLLTMCLFSGCEEAVQQVETIASQIDVEAIVTEVVQNIDWAELKNYAEKGYDALVEQFPALKGENVKAFLKDHGLKLLSNCNCNKQW